MNHINEFDTVIITSSLVGYDRQAISNVACNAVDDISITNMDIFITAALREDSKANTTQTGTVLRKWHVVTLARNASHLLCRVAENVIPSCLRGSLRVRGQRISPSSYLSKCESLLGKPKYVCPETFAKSLEGSQITTQGIKYLHNTALGQSALKWLEIYGCFTRTTSGIKINTPRTKEEFVVVFAIFQHLSANCVEGIDIGGAATACYLTNAVSAQAPSHLCPAC